MKYRLSCILLLMVLGQAVNAFHVDVGHDQITVDNQKVGEVYLNGEIIMRLYDTIEDQLPADRAQKVAQRITQLVALGLDPMKIKVYFSNGYYRGAAGDRVLFTVGKQEAQLNSTTEDMLAIEWITKIRKHLAAMPTSNVTINALADHRAQPVDPFPITGMASWFQSDEGGFFATHATVPRGTKLRVSNLDNGWTVVVTVTSNEDLPAGRVINLSQPAARALGLIKNGLARVKLTRVY